MKFQNLNNSSAQMRAANLPPQDSVIIIIIT